jgi:uncharacterized protein with PQ loop repeat
MRLVTCLYVIYGILMKPSKISGPPPQDSLRVELGSWFKAYATGRGVIAVPLVVLMLAAVVLIRVFAG